VVDQEQARIARLRELHREEFAEQATEAVHKVRRQLSVLDEDSEAGRLRDLGSGLRGRGLPLCPIDAPAANAMVRVMRRPRLVADRGATRPTSV
jgi:hypothetical protein